MAASTPPCPNTDRTIYWSQNGVLADSQTDNTAALNQVTSYASQCHLSVVGDCPAGGKILLAQQWIWQSNMNLKIQTGCVLQSTLDGHGNGSYAISQESLTVPLTNVNVDGLTISTPFVQADRVFKLYINHFKLTNWSVTQSGGVMFLRGSDQEIAYGKVTNTVAGDGDPGIRHEGNCLDGYCTKYRATDGSAQPCIQTPCTEAATTENKPANVFIHDNNIISGDGTYQACQPLGNATSGNVGTYDLVYLNNVGHSIHSALLLIGETGATTYGDWSCSNVTFNNVSEDKSYLVKGEGSHWAIHIASIGPANTYNNIVVSNSTFGNNSILSSDNFSGGLPAILIDALGGGQISNLAIINNSITNLAQGAVATFGKVTNFNLRKNTIAAPQMPGMGSIVLSEDTISSFVINNSIATNGNDAIQVGTPDNFKLVNGGGSGPGNPASQIEIAYNKIVGIGDTYVGIRLENVTFAKVQGNSFNSLPGAVNPVGILFSTASIHHLGTLDSKAWNNDLSQFAGSRKIIFAPDQGNAIWNNPGANAN